MRAVDRARRWLRDGLGPLLTFGSAGPERVADGVWRVRGNPGRLNIFLLADREGGVTQFDAGGRVMSSHLRRCVDQLGPLRRVVLSHAHTDHRGSAPDVGVPVWCHRDEVIDAEGTGGLRYWGSGLPRLAPLPRLLHLAVLQPLYDGGPVRVANTIEDGDLVAGFRVVHLPGHAPGLIALFRERDRVALTSDAFYTVDTWWRDCPPYLPGDAWNWNSGQARQSLLRLAELDPAVAWPGHGRPVTGNVRAALRAAAR